MSSLARSRSWEVVRVDPQLAARVERQAGVTPLVARIMAGRGITEPDAVERFLAPSLTRDWVDPALIPGLPQVVERLDAALEAGERIAVFGDFDVDGISATCLMTCALRDLGGEVVPFIPRRFDEGYGLSRAALDRLVEMASPDLIVTVDTGIAGKAEVAMLLEEGIDVAVTDHHEPADLVPQGVPVCDPKLAEDCPCRDLAGVGVALKVICELGARRGRPDLWRTYTDVATLGTVSDMMPLTGENRSLVADGVARLRTARLPGLAALAAQARHPLEDVSADELAYSIIPRLNSAGRMADPAQALDVLMATDPLRAEDLAAQLEGVNQERRAIEAELSAEAMALVESTYDGGRVIVVGGEGWHEGVKGIVASRLVNHFHVPALLFTISDGIARGSGRSVGTVNLFEAVERCSDLLVRFGGHAGAVGVTLESANLDAFRDRMEEVLSELPAEAFEDRRSVAAEVTLSEMDIDTIRSLDVLQPFGQGNEVPLLAACGVTMTDRRRRGEGGKHLSFTVTDGTSSVPCIMFNAADAEALVEYDGAIDLVFEPKVEIWQGRTNVKLHVRDVLLRTEEAPGSCAPATARLVDDLFGRSDEFLGTSEVADISQAASFHTKVVGVTFDGRQDVLASLHAGAELTLEREPANAHDPNAIAVRTSDGTQVGYLKRIIAAALAPEMDRGAAYAAVVSDVTGGAERGTSHGVNVLVVRRGEPGSDDALAIAARRRTERERLAGLDVDALTDELRALLIGDASLLPAQQRALDNLDAGTSTLCVMATGRGKSLIFHVHAARTALLRHRASVFVYPLRALVADQAFHLGRVFDQLGMTTRVLTGETSQGQREATFAGLADGGVDIVLTTPEFLALHSDRFAASGRVGFVVVDEAHHAGMAVGTQRPAYLEMPRVLSELGNPTVLAVTATADPSVAGAIRELLGIGPQGVVVDASSRDNLLLLDERNTSGRDDRLVSLLARGEKTLVYVNSREQTVSVARMLRHRVWECGHRVAFYNGGLTREDRAAVETAFRSGELTCVVSTSAFGEGVNLPDVRHVVLYHLPLDEVAFNQMSGRAGRDGADAWVHLAYGAIDARANERILAREAPARDDLATLYRVLMGRSRAARLGGEATFAATNADLASDCIAQRTRCAIDDHAVSCGIAIFRELGFVRTAGFGSRRRIEMVASPERMDLTRSIRYLEGLRAQQEFARYRDWALGAPGDEVLARISRPIVPDET